jgi:hypothetical protein
VYSFSPQTIGALTKVVRVCSIIGNYGADFVKKSYPNGEKIAHSGHTQGDQMSLLINGLKYSPTHYLSKLMHNFFRGKKTL